MQIWIFYAQIAQGVGAILSIIILGYIAYEVHRYTIRRDRLDFERQRWAETQQINLFYLNNPELLEEFENIVYGKDYSIPQGQSNKYTHLFIRINQIYHYYLSYKHGVMSYREFKENGALSYTLIARERETIKYLLENRGYTNTFAKEMDNFAEEIKPAAYSESS